MGSPSNASRHRHNHPHRPPQLHTDRLANSTIINDRYLLQKTIGKGSYGKVKLAVDLSDPHLHIHRALKFIPIESLKKEAHVARLRRETVLLSALHHPHLVKLVDHFQTAQDLVLVQEYVAGQDLFDTITKHPAQRLSETEARPIFRQLVSALHYCHAHNVVHRDIKPENVMVGEGGAVKLIDFGFANVFRNEGWLETNCGSPLYAAPEIVRGVPYRGPETDCWSLGVLLYAMLTGSLPFEDDCLKTLYEKICRGQYNLPRHVSPLAADLLRRMLVVDGRERAGIGEIGTHQWTCEGYGGPPSPHIPLRRPITSMDERVVRGMAADLGSLDTGSLKHDILATPDNSNSSPAYSLYRLYCEQLDRARTRRLPHGPLYTMSDLHAPLSDVDVIGQITVSDAGVPAKSRRLLLHRFDIDALLVRTTKPAAPHPQAVPARKQPEASASASYEAVLPHGIAVQHPHHHNTFLQQAVGHLNSQFRRIKNMINATSVHM